MKRASCNEVRFAQAVLKYPLTLMHIPVKHFSLDLHRQHTAKCMQTCRLVTGSCSRSQAFRAGDSEGQKRALGCDAASPVSESRVPSLGQHLMSLRRSWIRAPAAESRSGKQREARKKSAWWKRGYLSFRKVASNPKYEDR